MRWDLEQMKEKNKDIKEAIMRVMQEKELKKQKYG